jgi:hypothetical protein
MDDMVGRIQDDRNWLTRLGAKLPGFRGYIEKETRRDADKILRDTISDKFNVQARRITQLQMDLVSHAKLEHVDDMERAATKLKQFMDRVKTTPRGYAGFFDAIQVKEEQLEQLYQWDLRLLEEAEKFAATVDATASAISGDADIAGAVRALTDAAAQLNELYGQREHVLLGSV